MREINNNKKIKELELKLQSSPTDVKAHIALAKIYMYDREHASSHKAEQHIAKAAELDTKGEQRELVELALDFSRTFSKSLRYGKNNNETFKAASIWIQELEQALKENPQAPNAHYLLGRLYQLPSEQRNLDKAYHHLQIAADTNDAESLYALADYIVKAPRYAPGPDLFRDKKAHKLFKKAAEQGHLPAQIQLALHLSDEVGVYRNKGKALELIKTVLDNKDHGMSSEKIRAVKSHVYPYDYGREMSWRNIDNYHLAMIYYYSLPKPESINDRANQHILDYFIKDIQTNVSLLLNDDGVSVANKTRLLSFLLQRINTLADVESLKKYINNDDIAEHLDEEKMHEIANLILNNKKLSNAQKVELLSHDKFKVIKNLPASACLLLGNEIHSYLFLNKPSPAQSNKKSITSMLSSITKNRSPSLKEIDQRKSVYAQKTIDYFASVPKPASARPDVEALSEPANLAWHQYYEAQSRLYDLSSSPHVDFDKNKEVFVRAHAALTETDRSYHDEHRDEEYSSDYLIKHWDDSPQSDDEAEPELQTGKPRM